MSSSRTSWAAIGAAVAVSLGAGGVGLGHAAQSSGTRATFVAIAPCRLLDTRPAPDNVGSRLGPIGAGDASAHLQQVTGDNGKCVGIPGDATAVSLNVTVVNPSDASHLAVYPADAPAPLASNLNYVANQAATPNKVDVDLSDVGQIRIRNQFGFVDVIVDVAGYYRDHDHDDRYYTEQEADQRFLGAGAAELNVNVFDARPEEPGLKWDFEGGLHHAATAGSECVIVPIGVPTGRAVTGAVLTYASVAAVPVTVGAIGVRHTPGGSSGYAALGAGTSNLPSTSGQFLASTVAFTSTLQLDADRNHAVALCTKAEVLFIGFKLVLA